MSSLLRQLELRAESSQSGLLDGAIGPNDSHRGSVRRVASLLFDEREASKMDADTVFYLGRNGFLELRERDPGLGEFEAALFSDAARVEREARSPDEASALDRDMTRFLQRATPLLQLRAAHKALEWLVRGLAVHRAVPSALVGAALPFHRTAFFVRVVQVVFMFRSSADRSSLPSKLAQWSFLAPVGQAKEAAPIERSELAKVALRVPWLLDFVFQSVRTEELLISPVLAGPRHQLSLFVGLSGDTLGQLQDHAPSAADAVAQPMVLRLAHMFAADASHELVVAGMLVFVQLAAAVPTGLADDVFDRLVVRMLSDRTAAQLPLAVQTLVALSAVQRPKRVSGGVLSILAAHGELVADVVMQMAEGGSEVAHLAGAVASSCLDGEVAELVAKWLRSNVVFSSEAAQPVLQELIQTLVSRRASGDRVDALIDAAAVHYSVLIEREVECLLRDRSMRSDLRAPGDAVDGAVDWDLVHGAVSAAAVAVALRHPAPDVRRTAIRRALTLDLSPDLCDQIRAMVAQERDVDVLSVAFSPDVIAACFADAKGVASVVRAGWAVVRSSRMASLRAPLAAALAAVAPHIAPADVLSTAPILLELLGTAEAEPDAWRAMRGLEHLLGTDAAEHNDLIAALQDAPCQWLTAVSAQCLASRAGLSLLYSAMCTAASSAPPSEALTATLLRWLQLAATSPHRLFIRSDFSSSATTTSDPVPSDILALLVVHADSVSFVLRTQMLRTLLDFGLQYGAALKSCGVSLIAQLGDSAAESAAVLAAEAMAPPRGTPDRPLIARVRAAQLLGRLVATGGPRGAEVARTVGLPVALALLLDHAAEARVAGLCLAQALKRAAPGAEWAERLGQVASAHRFEIKADGAQMLSLLGPRDESLILTAVDAASDHRGLLAALALAQPLSSDSALLTLERVLSSLLRECEEGRCSSPPAVALALRWLVGDGLVQDHPDRVAALLAAALDLDAAVAGPMQLPACALPVSEAALRLDGCDHFSPAHVALRLASRRASVLRSLPSAGKRVLLEALCRVMAGDPTAAAAARVLLPDLAPPPEVISDLLLAMLRSPVISEDLTGPVAVALELASEILPHVAPAFLIGPLHGFLERLLAADGVTHAPFALQMVLSVLAAALDREPVTVPVGTLISAVHATSRLPQAQNCALAALTSVVKAGSVAADDVPRLFELVHGIGEMARDDEYTFATLDRLLAALVPAILRADESEAASRAQKLLEAALRVLPRLPSHRRSSFFSMLVKAMGGEFLVCAIIVLLVYRARSKSGPHISPILIESRDEDSDDKTVVDEEDKTVEDVLHDLESETEAETFARQFDAVEFAHGLGHYHQLYSSLMAMVGVAAVFVEGHGEGAAHDAAVAHVRSAGLTHDQMLTLQALALEFVADHVASRKFLEKQLREKPSNVRRLQPRYAQLFEALLRIVEWTQWAPRHRTAGRGVHRFLDPRGPRECGELQLLAFDALDGVQSLLSVPVYVAAIKTLLCSDSEPVRRQGLRLFSQRVELHCQQQARASRAAEDGPDPGTAAFLALVDELAAMVAGGSTAYVQQLLLTLEILARYFAHLYPDVFLARPADMAVSQLKGAPPTVAAGALMFLCALAAKTGANIVHRLADLVPAMLRLLARAMTDVDEGEETRALIRSSVISSIEVLLESVPTLLSPYLSALVAGLLQAQHNATPREAATLRQTLAGLAGRVEPRLFVPALASAGSLIKLGAVPFAGAVSLLQAAVQCMSPTELERQRQPLFKLLLQILGALLEAGFADPERLSAVEALVSALVLRMNERLFRSFYERLFEWARLSRGGGAVPARGDRPTDREERAAAKLLPAGLHLLRREIFYSTSVRLAADLSALFVPFVDVFLDDALALLALHVSRKRAARASGAVEEALARVQTHVLRVLTAAMKADADAWFSRDRIDALTAPLVDHLRCFASGLDAHAAYVARELAPAVCALAACCTDRALWGPINTHLLAHLRSPVSEVRLATIEVLSQLYDRFTHDYIALLPDSAVHFSELLEDSDPLVESRTRSMLQSIDSILQPNDSIDNYLT